MIAVTRAVRRARRCIAIRFLRNSKTTRTQRIIDENGQAYFRRERSFVQTMLIPVANYMLRSMHTRIAILRGAGWREWETRVYATLHHVVVRAAPRGLDIPEMPGHVLASYLADKHSTEEKRLAVKACLTALCEAHHQVITWPDGTHRTFSHADATARNVLFDPAPRKAHWIDFETLHSAHLSDDERRVDDLRAFIASIVEAWPDAVDHLPQLVYDGSLIPPKLREDLLAKLRRGPMNLYEEAQGSIPDRSQIRLVSGREVDTTNAC